MQTSVNARPLVSVVIPTYNRAHLVGRAIESVLAQTFADFELIVVDDGSTDNTLAVLGGFEDPRVRFLSLAGNRGASCARNVGIQAARGEFVAFLDSDDEWLPRKLELQLAYLCESDERHTTVVDCLKYWHDEVRNRTVVLPDVIFQGDVFEQLLRRSRVPTLSTAIVKRSSLLQVGGFDENLPCFQDYDLWLRLAQASNHFGAVNEALVIIHEHADPQISSDSVAKLRGVQILDRKWGPVIKRRSGTASYRRWMAGRYADVQFASFIRARKAVAHGHRVAAWRHCLAMCEFLPWSRRFIIHGLALTILGQRAYRALARVRDVLFRRIGG